VNGVSAPVVAATYSPFTIFPLSASGPLAPVIRGEGWVRGTVSTPKTPLTPALSHTSTWGEGKNREHAIASHPPPPRPRAIHLPKNRTVLDFGFWILDCGLIQNLAEIGLPVFARRIQNPKPKIQNQPGLFFTFHRSRSTTHPAFQLKVDGALYRIRQNLTHTGGGWGTFPKNGAVTIESPDGMFFAAR
jgi:hypothetical protein